MIKYEQIDISGDKGLRICGKTIEELFENAGIGMYTALGGRELSQDLTVGAQSGYLTAVGIALVTNQFPPIWREVAMGDLQAVIAVVVNEFGRGIIGRDLPDRIQTRLMAVPV